MPTNFTKGGVKVSKGGSTTIEDKDEDEDEDKDKDKDSHGEDGEFDDSDVPIDPVPGLSLIHIYRPMIHERKMEGKTG